VAEEDEGELEDEVELVVAAVVVVAIQMPQ
jgi:hypothetical protein